jgi:hypothetical protein
MFSSSIRTDVALDNAGASYTRLSAQVYLQHSDFERLGVLVLQLLAEVS